MDNRSLVFSFCVSVFFVILGYTMNYFKPDELPGTYLIGLMEKIALLFGFFIILRTSTIQHTNYFRVLLICLSLIMIGSLFTLQHWAYGKLIILIALSVVIVTYSFRFIQKKKKNFSDFLKLFLVFSYCLSIGFNLEHWQYDDALTIIFRVIFLLAIGSSIFQMRKTSFRFGKKTHITNDTIP